MNKLFKLIWVNILGLFDINKIIIARNDGVKSKLENKLVITSLTLIFIGFVMYSVFELIKIKNIYLIVSLGFMLSSFVCFMMNIHSLEATIFKDDDNDILFTLPVSKEIILFSKVFMYYLKNILITSIIMGVSLLSYYNIGGVMDENFGIMIFLMVFCIPIVPIILATIVAFVMDYIKVKIDNKYLKGFIKLLLFGLLFILVLLFIKNINGNNIDSVFNDVFKKFNYLYPLLILFNISLFKGNLFSFIIYILINVLVLYLYNKLIIINYQKLCSMLKGINKKNNFVYKKKLNLGKVMGNLKKEFIILFKNKLYFKAVIFKLILFSFITFIIVNIVKKIDFSNIEDFNIYLNLFVPPLLSLISSIVVTTTYSFSLEKDHIYMLGSMPISFNKILFSKWLCGLIVGSFFVLVNGLIANIYLDLEKWGIIYSFLMPFVTVAFITGLGLLLDIMFINKNEKNDSYIINERIINLVPTGISLLVGCGIFFLDIHRKYAMLLGGYNMIMVIGIIIIWLYLIIMNKKLYNNLLK